MKYVKMGLLVAGLVAASHVGHAQIQQGAQEISVFGSFQRYSFDGGDDVTNLSGQASYGYFFTDALALSAGYGISYTDDGANDSTSHFVTIGADYYFPMDGFAPYVGAGAAFYVPDGDADTETMGEVRAGMKQFISERTAIDYRVSYAFGSEIDVLGASVGISFYIN